MLSIQLANPQDASRLAEVQKRTFDHDAQQYQNKLEDGPPGYGSSSWQSEMMMSGQYYKLLENDVIIGGMILFPSENKEECHLGRIYIDPNYQNRGYGQEAFLFLFSTFSSAQKWTLDTPSWAVRNHHFYKKQGFVQIAEVHDAQSGEALIQYERITEEARP
ncbi:GNAT family N-acetyltransferase [Paenibacillus sp. HW567]|uniref:GNAT family N-acetyltransferase n=1 Tax=Paenibacillus sp. HW567 TaxID=1034769 RepID=UPI000374F493|nr:GNAT family N-acetyltransferase [Paenibacillus sp. HW567]